MVTRKLLQATLRHDSYGNDAALLCMQHSAAETTLFDVEQFISKKTLYTPNN